MKDKEALLKSQKKYGFILPEDITKWDFYLSCAVNKGEIQRIFEHWDDNDINNHFHHHNDNQDEKFDFQKL